MRSLIILPVVAIALAAAGCKHEEKAIQPVFADGAISVSIRDAKGLELGGIGKVTYQARGKKLLRSDSAAFTGRQPVPVHVVVEKDDLDLVKIELASSAAHPLTTVGADELARWIAVARKGVALEVTVSDAGVQTALRMLDAPPVLAAPDTNLRPIPDGVLEGDDVSSSLNALRYAASATDEYHQELVALVSKANNLTAAQLATAVAGAYYNGHAFAQLGEFFNASRGDREAYEALTRESWEALRSRAEAGLALARKFAPYTNAMLDQGVAKVTDLSFENGLMLLERLIALENQEVGTAAFKAVTDAVKLTGEQKLALAHLAFLKRNYGVAERLVLDWYQNDAGRSVSKLAEELGHLPEWNVRDAILLGAEAEMPTLSASDLAALVGLSSGGDTTKTLFAKGAPFINSLKTSELIALMGQNNASLDLAMQYFYSKVSDLNAQNEAAIGAHLSGDARTQFIVNYLAAQKTLGTDDFTALVSLLDGDLRDQTILDWLPRITERDSVHLAQLFGLLTPDSRARHLLKFIDALPSLTTDALIALSQAAPERSSFILLAYIDRLSDFTPANGVKIAQHLNYADRDSVLLLVMERAKTVTAEDLADVARNAYQKGNELIEHNLGKISPLTAQGVANLAVLINGYSRDEFVTKALEKLGTVKTDELVLLANSTYGKAQEILAHHLDQVSDLTVDNTILLAGRVSGGEQEQVVRFWFTKNAAVSTQDLIRLASASYYAASRIMIDNAEKVSDLTVDNAITVAGRMGGGDRDTFLLKAVLLVTDLSSDNLLKLANQSYGSRDAVIQKGVERLSHHP